MYSKSFPYLKAHLLTNESIYHKIPSFHFSLQLILKFNFSCLFLYHPFLFLFVKWTFSVLILFFRCRSLRIVHVLHSHQSIVTFHLNDHVLDLLSICLIYRLQFFKCHLCQLFLFDDHHWSSQLNWHATFKDLWCYLHILILFTHELHTDL